MERLISLASEISKRISRHISDLWPGFSPVPFILYNGTTQVAVGEKTWPDKYSHIRDNIWLASGHDPRLMGNTAITYHGVPTAIWDVRTWPEDVDIARAAGGVAHEMFHVYQRESMQVPMANELLPPQYPHSGLSLALLIEENKWLLRMRDCPNTVAECLGKIVALRKQREADVGARFMEYDKCCESFEGSATYVEMRMRALVEGGVAHEAFVESLDGVTSCVGDGGLLDNYRHRCYAAGLALCLACDIMWPGWQRRWQDAGCGIFDWVAGQLRVDTADIVISASDLKAASDLLSAYRRRNRQKVNEFMAQPLTLIEGDIQLLVFDPMGLVCADGRCLHLHGSFSTGGKEWVLDTPFMAEYGDTILDIKRVFIPTQPSLDDTRKG